MTNSILKSLLLLAVMCPIYIAIVGTCCNKCSDSNPCTPSCYAPESPCPNPNIAGLADGTECPFSGGIGQCVSAECVEHECADPAKEFDYCDHPRGNLNAGSNSGICINKVCVSLTLPSGQPDHCVKRGVGRISCCSQTGCQQALGSRCPPSGFEPDTTSCDLSGVDPNNPMAGQAGQCTGGYCASGACQPPDPTTGFLGTCESGVYTTSGIPTLCVVDICDPTATGSHCRNPEVEQFGEVQCASGKTCKAGAVCSVGAPCEVECDESPNDCVIGTCDDAKRTKGGACPDKVCCTNRNVEVGTKCDLPGGTGNEDGMCDSNGVCIAPVCG